VTDLVRPRICHVPDAADWSLGDRAVEWSRDHKLRLDPEQEFMLRSMLGLDSDGRYQSFEFGLSAPRQNGKGEVLLARELFGLYELGERLIIHSAHEFKTSARHFKRLEIAIRANPDLLAAVERSDIGQMRMVGFRYSHGDESIKLQDGSMIEFRTRTKSGLKGVDDVALLVLDESQILSEWAHGTMVPTLRASTAQRGPQLVYAGNAPDQDKDDHAIVWTRLRERALAGDEDSLVYHEYSLDYESPEEVPEGVASDPVEWAKVNWAMAHGRVTVKHMQKEFRLFQGGRQFMTELLNVGDYPDTDLIGNSEISLEAWADCEDEGSVLEDPVCLAFDISPGRRTTISASGLNRRRKLHVEVVNSRAGTAWVPERMLELCESHEVVQIICDGFGPANAIAAKVEEQTGLKVRRMKTGEYADACGQFANAIDEHDMVHLGQEELNTSVRGARTRPLVDRWAWSRSKSKTDPGPVIACSIALWSAVDRDIANREEMVIF
jgi:hypothetical protein